VIDQLTFSDRPVDAEAWKISCQQSSGFIQELKTTPLTEYFRPINLTIISSGVFLQRNGKTAMANITAINNSEDITIS